MNIATAKEHIKDTIEAYLQRDDAGMYTIDPSRQRPIFLVGAPGIGKTAIIEQIALELGIGVVSYSMTHHTRQSALGLPRIVHRSFEGFDYDASEYTMSEIVSAIYDYMERSGERKGILFLDEINCVSETLYPSMLQFLQFKTFGRHRVPEDWVIVCAGNPPEYNKSVHEFDIVTLDRLREIDVEPDYSAWKRYATEKGLHPAVTTFLEAKPDCFYLVESKPGGGKSFVTARGWEDLAEVISLYEQLGKACDRDLFAQFLRDDDIVDKFSVYYSLFEKYRSDYQIGRILAGDVDSEIVERAKSAEFDERIALLGLILDALGLSSQEALDQEGVVLELRDELREAKPKLLSGSTVEDAIIGPLRARESRLSRKVAAGTITTAQRRKENLVMRKLREIASACTVAGAESGEEAFSVVNEMYRREVDKIEPKVSAADVKMNNAFSFIERAFGTTREIIVFVAELSTRTATTQFIAHYGNDRYYAHNEELQVDETRKGLAERVRDLQEIERSLSATEYIEDSLGADLSGAAGIRSSVAKRNMVDPTASTPAEKTNSSFGKDQLDRYYNGKQFEWGFASMSRMTLPALKGMRVLDVCCRRGKGVYKISSMVGAEGQVIGVDWSPSYIADAEDGVEHAIRKNHLKESNMEFHVAFPEDLMEAGIGNSSVDVVYINNVMTLVYDADKTLSEFYRVLKPGGLLICETVFASGERDDAIIEKARSIGNSVQAARTEGEFMEKLSAAGFANAEIVDEMDVSANQGFKANHLVDTVEDDADVKFSAVAINARKPE